MIRRLDHLILEVPDIERAFRRLHEELGFPVAWPIGPFWPDAMTAGIAIGGINLELVAPSHPPDQARLTTFVFEPSDIALTRRELEARGLTVTTFVKVEPDPYLLLLRGFPKEQVDTPQEICTNLLLEGKLPLPMFFCRYVPFLRDRLAPERFAMPFGPLHRIRYPVPDPTAACALVETAPDIPKLEFVTGQTGEGAVLEYEHRAFGVAELAGLDA